MVQSAFTGGDALKKRLAEIAENLKDGGTLRVGFLEGSTEEDGTSIPMIAAIQEFGAPDASIPPRPYFRTMISSSEGDWGDEVAKILKANDYDVEKSLRQMGARIAGQLQESIIDIVSPPLSDVTLMLRQMRADDPDLVVTGSTVGEAARRVAAGETAKSVSTKPLVDSGTMLNSVSYDVET